MIYNNLGNFELGKENITENLSWGIIYYVFEHNLITTEIFMKEIYYNITKRRTKHFPRFWDLKGQHLSKLV